MVQEMKNARVWGGMHFRHSTDVGADLGKNVAKWVAKHHFEPVESDDDAGRDNDE